MKRKEKSFKEKCIEEDIDFLNYLNVDLHFKYWMKPSKVALINGMILDTINALKREKSLLRDRRLLNDRR